MAKILPIDRRQLIQYGGAFLGTSLMATILGNQMAGNPAAQAQSTNQTPQQLLTQLMEGNGRFTAQKRVKANQDLYRLAQVAQGQNPFAAILSCADSRVPPEIIFDQGLGDLFICRIAGNIATPQEVGSLEFGTLVLGAKVLMVLGHQGCGAVKAAMDGGELPGQIASVIEKIDIGSVTDDSSNAASVAMATKANVEHQMAVLGQSPVLGQLIAEEKLVLVGAYYNLDSGAVTLL
ncbi:MULTISPECIES: carbonic anhydrase [unclassified Synechocystis]|uniref:carbonic anhydrase n=1 Tax=unclassified Synechocystis TaxID=2640012 RepID=UPI00040DFF64|nr:MULTISPECIES: carbonic anhydrase [unclassified Synechocystis]AIE73286.1 Carbonic anhydrase [Synechocystis sp. PCC 6714]